MTAPARVRRLAAAGCTVAWITACVVSHLPASALRPLHTGDKTLHFLGFLLLGTIFLLTLRAHGLSLRRGATWATGILLIYAAGDEITQPLVGRTCELRDWLADTAGILAAVLLHLLFVLLLRIRRAPPGPAGGKGN